MRTEPRTIQVDFRLLVGIKSTNANIRSVTRSVESNETELVLVPTDGSEVLWLARTG